MNTESGARREVAARKTGWARRLAAGLARAGVRPNFISFMSVVFAGAAGVCLVLAGNTCLSHRIWLYVGAAIFIQLRLLCNLFDGMVAVEGGLGTKSGEVFNDLPDRISDPLIFIGAGYAVRALPWGIEAGWLAGLLAVLTAYARLLGGSTGAGQFFAGPMAKQHRLAVITLALLLAAGLASRNLDGKILLASLIIVAAGSAITVIRRIRLIVSALESGGNPMSKKE